MRLRVFVMACLLALPPSAGGQAPASSSLIDSQAFFEQQLAPLPPLASADAQRIRDLLGHMSVKEKVGQMTQLEIGMVTDGRDAELHINPDKLRKAVVEYGVGALLN